MGQYGLGVLDDPFEVLGIRQDGGTLRQARSQLARLSGFWTPHAAPERLDADKLAAYRKAVHAYLVLSYPGLWGEPMERVLEVCPYPDIDAGEADPDWALHFLAGAIGEAEEERDVDALIDAGLLQEVGQHLVGLPPFLAGERIREIDLFEVSELIEELRTYPEVSELQLPTGSWAWAFTWRTTRWMSEGTISRFDVAPLPVRDRALWVSRDASPLWEVTVNMPWWLAATPAERRALMHNILVRCRVNITGEGDELGWTPKVAKPSLKADGLHLARFGAPDLATAHQVAAAFYHPHTRALLEQGEREGKVNRYDLRATGDVQMPLPLEPHTAASSGGSLDDEDDALGFDDTPFGALAGQGREAHA